MLVYRQAVEAVFTSTTGWFILVGSVAFFLTFLWCKESVVRTTPRVSVKDTIATIRNNKALAYLCGASFFYLIGLFAVGGDTAFYAKFVLGDIGGDRHHDPGQLRHRAADHPTHPVVHPQDG